MNTTRFLGTTLVGLMATVTAAAQSGVTNSAPVLFETATLGELGDFGGYSIFNAKQALIFNGTAQNGRIAA